jgi:hypothetical protein
MFQVSYGPKIWWECLSSIGMTFRKDSLESDKVFFGGVVGPQGGLSVQSDRCLPNILPGETQTCRLELKPPTPKGD